MKRINRLFVFLLAAVLQTGALAEGQTTWKEISDAQLQLHLLKTQKEMAEIRDKMEEAQRAKEDAIRAREKALEPPTNPFSPSVLAGQNPAQIGAPIPPGAGSEQRPEKSLELISIYGVDKNNLIADVLFGKQLVAMSPTNDRAVRWANGWRIVSVDPRKITMRQLMPEDKDGQASGKTITLALKSAPLAPVVGDTPVSSPQNRIPAAREDSAFAARITPPPAPNVNQARPGSPIPSQLLINQR